ncbi:hypothetical protein ABOM_009868 [Aspergillus bombycis]|uniref:Uncharacterized protein n=1 Tax=Aspergillus bombycis TaxID=109264 RepID=A0A1F7ZP12_9EURO|nr:hypothetical protein ABOM_009868 [Aspergillus bombycis]OGM41177.1 hypothetical protein ABOM_009868 [Aspergillus bombycis]
MTRHPASSPYVRHKHPELRRLYEPLSLLYVLREQIPERRPIAVINAGGVGGILQRRRDFLNALVELAAFKQGYDLAITAGYDHENVIIAVAGNQDVSDLVVPFLERLLGMVTSALHVGLNDETCNRELSNISNYVMEWQNDNSFAVYHSIFDHIAPICIPVMATGTNDPKGMAMVSLWETFVSSNGMALLKTDMPALVHNCFSASQDGKFEIFQRFVCQSQRFVDMFEEFHRQLLNLAMPMEMCRLLLKSAISIRQDLHREIKVYHVPPEERMKIPLVRKKLNLDEIANRMFSERQRFKQLRQGLERVVPAPSRLIEQLKDYQENVYTQIHPELRLVDFFDKNSRVQYFDNYDRYIATSKPCCYLCNQYLSHRLNYHIRKCDPNHLDLHWRLPDIRAVEPSTRFIEQKEILRKITERIRRDVEKFVLDRCSESNDSSDDDTSQSFSLSTETTTTWEEASYAEANECSHSYIFPSGTEGDKHPGPGRCDGMENEDDKDTVVFKGRKAALSIP